MEIDVTKLSSKGQIVIPEHIRKRIGWREGETVAVSLQDGLVVLKKIHDPLEVADLQTLQEIKEAWNEIAHGRCKRLTSDDFLREIARW